MEKTTLDSLNWQLGKGMPTLQLMSTLPDRAAVGDSVSASDTSTPHRTTLSIRRRFQFSSALKRMSTICSLPNGRLVIAVKGAPETIKGMLAQVPQGYDDTYKYYTRRGSRVLALGFRERDNLSTDKVRTQSRECYGIQGLRVVRYRSTNCLGMRSRAA